MKKVVHHLKIKTPKKDLEIGLIEPDINVYGAAQVAGTNSTGKFDMIAAGKCIFDFCAVEGDIKEVKADVMAYATACLESYKLIGFYDSEIKKN